MAMNPDKIGTEKSFNSFNTGQLEGTYGSTVGADFYQTCIIYRLILKLVPKLPVYLVEDEHGLKLSTKAK